VLASALVSRPCVTDSLTIRSATRVAVCVRTYSGGHEILSTRSKAEKTPDAKNQAEQALQAIDRRKDEFLAPLDRDLRSPRCPSERW
jgi:thiamine monophosphate synthase